MNAELLIAQQADLVEKGKRVTVVSSGPRNFGIHVSPVGSCMTTWVTDGQRKDQGDSSEDRTSFVKTEDICQATYAFEIKKTIVKNGGHSPHCRTEVGQIYLWDGFDKTQVVKVIKQVLDSSKPHKPIKKEVLKCGM